MKQIWDVAIAASVLEEDLLKLKKLIADGNWLKGHTAKPLADVDQFAVKQLVGSMEAHLLRLTVLVRE